MLLTLNRVALNTGTLTEILPTPACCDVRCQRGMIDWRVFRSLHILRPPGPPGLTEEDYSVLFWILRNIIIIPKKLMSQPPRIMKKFVLMKVSRRRETTLETYKRKLSRPPFTLLQTPRSQTWTCEVALCLDLVLINKIFLQPFLSHFAFGSVEC